MGKSRKILITGTSRGIGRALAESLAESGHKVVGCSRGESSVQHANYIHITTDISVDEDIHNLISSIGSTQDGLEVLINNAGQKIDSPALLTTTAQTSAMLQTNFIGAMMITRESLKLMKRGRFGRVINISSIAVPLASKGASAYSATKAALAQFGHVLAREVADDDITVNTIGISMAEGSGMVERLDPQSLERTRSSLLKPDNIGVEEVAHAVEFFISDSARNITDQTLYFGGAR